MLKIIKISLFQKVKTKFKNTIPIIIKNKIIFEKNIPTPDLISKSTTYNKAAS